jgi:SAM-dependent methyltransferase
MSTLVSAARKILPSGVKDRVGDALRALAPERLLPGLVQRYCVGRGLEVGAGPRPYTDPSRTEYLDKHTDNAHGTRGADVVGDAARIPRPDGSFDYLLSSHCLEHHPDTIRTLNEWARVLKPGGILFLILPHADRTFDRHREKTTLEHHLQEFGTLEGEDRSHIPEAEAGMRRLEDLAEMEAMHRQTWGADFWDWDHRFANDAFHYHVWTQDEIVRLLQHLGFRILFVEEAVRERMDSFVVVARKG